MRFKFPNNPWPVAITTYFIGFAIFTVTAVISLSRHKMDLVRGDYYEEEIRYQQQLDRINRTRPVLEPTTITYDAARQVITFALPKSQLGNRVSGRLRLYRPSNEKLDREIKLEIGDDGSQRLDASQLQPGLWKVRVYWSAGGQDYYLADSIVVSRS
ncbi:MAG TPA: FixH family protein [Verrucomicrobiae bacterium]|jgi:hypothetical protein|nr:FixH family protein [Verrucomicrobiae bacterium]